MNIVITTWKYSLTSLLRFYERKRGRLERFYPNLFLFFVFINILCYWWALFTAFPELAAGREWAHYFKIQFPVGFLGALFDSLSFFVTVFIIRRAIRSNNSIVYVSHLCLDLVIAVLATFWVLFVFSFSSWLIGLTEAQKGSLAVRNEVYQEKLVEAVAKPTDNLRNIYFGIIMGVSAMIPTCVHVYMFFLSCIRVTAKRITRPLS